MSFEKRVCEILGNEYRNKQKYDIMEICIKDNGESEDVSYEFLHEDDVIEAFEDFCDKFDPVWNPCCFSSYFGYISYLPKAIKESIRYCLNNFSSPIFSNESEKIHWIGAKYNELVLTGMKAVMKNERAYTFFVANLSEYVKCSPDGCQYSNIYKGDYEYKYNLVNFCNTFLAAIDIDSIIDFNLNQILRNVQKNTNLFSKD
jgi:hypothetical protein